MVEFRLKKFFCAVALIASGCGESAAEPFEFDFNSLPADPDAQQVQSFFNGLDEARSHLSSLDFYNAAGTYFNCYAYASGSTGTSFIEKEQDRLMNVRATPGALAGRPMEIFTAAELHKATIADGFDFVEPEEYTGSGDSSLEREGYTLVAAFIDDTFDNTGTSFHYAVRGEDGRWTHKNGMGDVRTERIGAGGPLRAPHTNPEDYLGDRYKFVGYYWRPEAGIDVIAGDPAVSAFNNDGSVVSSKAYDTDTMMSDIWIGTRGDYIATSFEIDNIIFMDQQNDAYKVTIVGSEGRQTSISVPESLVFPERDKDWKRTGNRIIHFDDPSGNDHILQIRPDGQTSLIETDPVVQLRSPESPFDHKM